MDQDLFPTLEKQTLVDEFIAHFEKMIISGQLAIGETLPSERELASRLGVSRPVVHEGLIDLEIKGLITRASRGGAVVNDYRYEGSLNVLNSLLKYHDGVVDVSLAKSTLNFRLLVEVEFARLAARNRSQEQLEELRSILAEEKSTDIHDSGSIAQIDFKFHHRIALATGNIFYPLLLNSFKDLYINGATIFFSDPALTQQVFDYHQRLFQSIADQDQEAAAEIMREMLNHGRDHYLRMVSS